jgi:hypothetical protein
MFVKYKPKDPHIKTIPIAVETSGGKAVPLASDSVILRPGTNELTEGEWDAIQPHVQEEIKQKIIVSFTVEVEKNGSVTKARTLKDVPVSVARKIIESCQNVDDLKKWVKQELSDEIMLLVLKRLRKLRIDPDEFSDDISGDEDTLDDDITIEGGGEGGTEEESTKRRKRRKTGGKKNGGEVTEGPEVTEDDEDTEDDDGIIPDFDGSGGQE